MPKKINKIPVKLLVIDKKGFTADYQISARSLFEIDPKEFNFNEFQEEIGKTLDELEEKRLEGTKFSLLNYVYNTLLNVPVIQRNKDHTPLLNKAGEQQLVPHGDERLRVYNRILKEVEKGLDKYGKLSQNHKTFTIYLKPSDALELAQRMQKELMYMNLPASFVIECIDHFIDIEAIAKKGGEENE